MKSVFITHHGGPSALELRETAIPACGETQVHIQVAASGVNFADLMMRTGMYPEAPKLPFVPGYEVAGKVAAVGRHVTQYKVGDRVVAATKFGGYTTDIFLDPSACRKIPDHMSEAEAACVPVNFLTAYVALNEMARVRAHDRVLILSAAGGVGVAAVQLAAEKGAHITGLVGSDAKAETVRVLGAREIILNQDFEKYRAANRPRYDVILDSVGGKSLKQNMKLLSPTGRVVSFGISRAVTGEKRSLFKFAATLLGSPLISPFSLMTNNRGIFGVNLLTLFEEPGRAILQRAFDQIMEGFTLQKYRAVVGKTFPLDQAGAAQEYLRSRKNIGKVVLKYYHSY